MVPLQCPDVPLLTEIKDLMMVAYRSLEKEMFQKQNMQRMNDIRFDMAKKGGRLAFRTLRDDDKQISLVFQSTKTFHLKKQRIFHTGQKILFIDDARAINPDLPICYETQCVLIHKGEGNKVFPTEPIFLRTGKDYITQTDVIASEGTGVNRFLEHLLET